MLREACPNNLAPTSSLVCALALSDALAMAISSQNNFTIKDFAKTHPEGELGRRVLITVSDIMIRKKLPFIRSNDKFTNLLNETTKHNLGLVMIIGDDKKLIGVITDGDIKRIIKKHQNFESIKIKSVMTKKPFIVNSEMLAVEALSIFEENNINTLPVVDKDKIVGILKLENIIKSIK